ncbi:hypothetical protein [Acetobacter aceti]|nr:hypothetical protein [Acetobacter aceti]
MSMPEVFAEEKRREDAKDKLLRVLAERFEGDIVIMELVRAAWGGGK